MKILIAEDDPLTLDAMAECVESEGFSVLCASDGRQALDHWRAHSPDLLCLNIIMPYIDGYELCKRVRKSDPRVPILFLCAKNDERDVVAGLNLGADVFVPKPFTRGEIMARIRSALRRMASPTQDNKAFMLGELKVMPDSLSAYRGEESIDLTQREADMLKLLHEHQGRPVSRDVFFHRCWGMDYFPNSRTLDQHIVILRKKVEREPSKPEIILTVRGIGYRSPQEV